MSLLPAVTEISDTYPLPSNATARLGFSRLWTAINEFFQKSELDLAAASTCDIGGQASTKLRIIGSTTINSLGTNYRGPIYLRMSGTPIIVHNATTLRCPGGSNIATAAGDVFVVWPTATVSGTLDGWQIARLAYAGGDLATISNRGIVELATDAEAQGGTDVTRAVTPDNLGAVVLGLGQTWQDVKTVPGRAASTTYTNSTGRPIMVCVGLVTSATCSIIAGIGGITFAGSSYAGSGGVNYVAFVVPTGGTYSVANNAGTSAVSSWAELR